MMKIKYINTDNESTLLPPADTLTSLQSHDVSMMTNIMNSLMNLIPLYVRTNTEPNIFVFDKSK